MVIISFAIVAVLAGASLFLALMWQNAQEAAPELEPAFSQPASDTPVVSDDETSSNSESEPQPSSTASSETPSAESGAPEDTTEPRPPINGALPQSAKVDNAYFEDAIFFGDSISTGIPIYQVAGSPDTVAVKGLSPNNILTEALVVTPSGESMTVLDAAKQYGEKKKVYIMLGSNGLWMDKKSFIQNYNAFINAVKEQYPGAVIYLQSMPPVTTEAKKLYPDADNAVIRELNESIAQLAKQNGVYFVDVAQALTDAEGNLPMEASPTDGMHLTPEYYQKWFEYLKTHTVEEKAQ